MPSLLMFTVGFSNVLTKKMHLCGICSTDISTDFSSISFQVRFEIHIPLTNLKKPSEIEEKILCFILYSLVLTFPDPAQVLV